MAVAVHRRFIRAALQKNRPKLNALRNRETMDEILLLMMQLGYIARLAVDDLALSRLHRAEDELRPRDDV